MSPPDAAASPSPNLRMWRGWDAPDVPCERPPHAPGLDQLPPEALIERIADTAPSQSRETLRAYLAHKLESGRKHSSIKGIGGALAKFARALDTVGASLETAEADDIATAFGRMRDGLSDTSHQLHVTHVRAFYRWKHEGHLPRQVALATPRETPTETGPLNAATPEEFEKLLAACEGLRYESETRLKAILWVLWDAGLQRRELVTLRIRDVHAEPDDSVTLTIQDERMSEDTSTLGSRTLQVHDAAPHLRAWLAAHPHQRDAEASLWPSPSDPRRPVRKGGFNIALARLSHRAGIRTVQPRDLREARIARAAREGWHEARMREYFGWARDSNRPAMYAARA